MDSLLFNRIKALNKEVSVTKTTLTKINQELLILDKTTNKTPEDQSQIANRKADQQVYSEKIKSLETALNKSIKERNELKLLNTDTNTTYYTQYFSVDRNAFFDSLNVDNFDTNENSIKKYVQLNLIDPTLIATDSNYTNIIKGTAFLKKESAKSKVAFINKYPSFGFWLFLSVAQMCIWFITAAIIILSTYNTFMNFSNLPLKLNWAQEKIKIIAFIVLVIIAMCLFLFFTYYLLIDGYVIEDHIFMEYFGNKMIILAFFGYIIASTCFIIYLLLAYKGIKLDDLNAKAVLVPGSPNQRDLESLTSTFNYSFGISALILSVFVLWLGVMFKSINSLELMNYYYQISGNQYLNNDYVYLVGLIHSLLLLIFYIPAQLRFNSLDIVKQQATLVGGTPGFISSITTFFSKLSPALITASPLLTSFVQNLLTSAIGG